MLLPTVIYALLPRTQHLLLTLPKPKLVTKTLNKYYEVIRYIYISISIYIDIYIKVMVMVLVMVMVTIIAMVMVMVNFNKL